MEDELKVVAESHHRNGVAGEGFTVRIVEDMDNASGPRPARMVVITFDSDPMRTAVLEIDRLADGDIEFGSNSWRGDHYAWSLGLEGSGSKVSAAFGPADF